MNVQQATRSLVSRSRQIATGYLLDALEAAQA